MERFKIYLKTFLGLAMPDKWYESKYLAGFWVIFYGQKSQTFMIPILYKYKEKFVILPAIGII